jgi:hypothetical protein
VWLSKVRDILTKLRKLADQTFSMTRHEPPDVFDRIANWILQCNDQLLLTGAAYAIVPKTSRGCNITTYHNEIVVTFLAYQSLHAVDRSELPWPIPATFALRHRVMKDAIVRIDAVHREDIMVIIDFDVICAMMNLGWFRWCGRLGIYEQSREKLESEQRRGYLKSYHDGT